MASQNTTQDSSEPRAKKWKTEKILENYADADSYRKSLIEQDPEDDFLVKIRRCGPGGSRFKVKSWIICPCCFNIPPGNVSHLKPGRLLTQEIEDLDR